MAQGRLVEAPARRLALSGQGPFAADPAAPGGVALRHAGDLPAQLALSLANLDAVLAAAGMARADLVSLRVLTTDMDGFLAAEGALLDWLRAGGARPTRTLLGVARLTEAAQAIELEAEAAV